MLCEICHDIFGRQQQLSSDKSRDISHGHHPSLASFYESVARGCQICTILHDSPAVQRELAYYSTTQSHVTYYRASEIGSLESLYFGVTFMVQPDEALPIPKTDKANVRFELFPRKVFPLGEKSITDATNSRDVISQISNWVNECVLHHENCGKDIDPLFVPARLLDLGEPSVRHNLRLIISDEHFSEHHESSGSHVYRNSHGYVTLSHCWGTSSTLKLLQSNELLFRKSIAFNRLPKSFRHAIEVTRWLGMRYLWIDSLCIVQDSPQDWREEAAVMSEIYRNSFCNIAATAASNSSIGLFFTRNPDVVSTTVVKPNWAEASDGEFAVVQPHEELMKKFNEEPLLQRAWVLQERLLAQRAIHFAKEQVFFECRQHLACEVYPCGIPYPHGEDCKKCVRDYFIHRIVDSKDEDFRGLRREIVEWNNVVERYTKCALTFGSDKLIALSGIATYFHRTKLPREQYLAGTWACHMPDALLWNLIDGTRSPPDQYRAPSWSWASVDGAVDMGKTQRYGSCFYTELTEFLDAEITTVDHSPTGQVTAGHLRVLGLLARANFGFETLEIFLHSQSRSISLPTGDDWWSRWKLVSGAVIDETLQRVSSTRVTVLFVRYQERPAFPGRYMGLYPCLHGLVLEPADGGVFKRIGTFMIAGKQVSDILQFLEYPRAKVVTLI